MLADETEFVFDHICTNIKVNDEISLRQIGIILPFTNFISTSG